MKTTKLLLIALLPLLLAGVGCDEETAAYPAAEG